MTSVSRTSQFAKVHKVLKKHYTPVVSDAARSVLEHLLFACCLEDAHYEAAEESLAAIVHTFFDWNEVRVTTISELSEVVARLPDPRGAANRLKRILQSVFENTYSFDLEEQRKKNLGPTIKWFEKLDGATSFSVAYVVQAALGGHAIPVGPGELRVLRIADLITDKDVEERVVPGIERAVAKSRGVEFSSLLHQLAADFVANPYAPAVREILLEINPDCHDHLPKRRADRKAGKKADEEPETAAGDETAVEEDASASPPAAQQAEVPAADEKGGKKEDRPAVAAKKEKSEHHAEAGPADTSKAAAAAKSESGKAAKGETTGKAEAHKGEAHKAEGHKAEGHKAEGHKAEEHKPEGHKPESHKAESHKSETHKAEAAKASGSGKKAPPSEEEPDDSTTEADEADSTAGSDKNKSVSEGLAKRKPR